MQANDYGFEWLREQLTEKIIPELEETINIQELHNEITKNQAYGCRMALKKLFELKLSLQKIRTGESAIVDDTFKKYIPPVEGNQVALNAETEFAIPRNVSKIGTRAFYKNENLKKITVPEGVVELADYAFKKCKNVEEIVLPESLERMGVSVFSECKNLKRIRIPSKVTQIGRNMFQDCTRLEAVVLPDSVRVIGRRAFCGSGLREIEIPEGVTTIQYECFLFCEQLERVSLPTTVKEIEAMAFEVCKKLKEINIPDGLTTLGGSCFGACRSLKTLSIPASVTEIDLPFYDCLGLNVLTPKNSAFSLWYKDFIQRNSSPFDEHYNRRIKEVVEMD